MSLNFFFIYEYIVFAIWEVDSVVEEDVLRWNTLYVIALKRTEGLLMIYNVKWVAGS